MATSAGIVVNFNHLPDMIRNNPRLADAAIDAMANDGERIVKQSMQDSPADGRTYEVGTGQVHVASSPGNPPRVDTGALINSIYVRNAGLARRMIGVGTDYGFILEFGSEKMAARPFMAPMVAQLQQHAARYFDDMMSY